MTTAPVLLETLVRVAPFGIRFWDAALDRPVDEGLQVTLVPKGQPFRRIPAFRNTSGVFVAQDLPGLRAWEFGASGVPSLPFRVEVVDLAGRFHAVAFDADLPTAGLFEALCGSPPSPPDGPGEVVPLFSLPARPVPPGYASVRAGVTLANGDGAHLASLDVSTGPDRTARGFADARGQVLTLVEYPEPSGSTGSPPFSPGGKLSDQTWQVEVAASLPATDPDPLLPDLCAFALRRPATLDTGATQTLVYGRDLVLPELVVVPS